MRSRIAPPSPSKTDTGYLTGMVKDGHNNPSDAALAHLKRRIEGDDSLDAAIKKAVLDDLNSTAPSKFERLSKALTDVGEPHAADGPASE